MGLTVAALRVTAHLLRGLCDPAFRGQLRPKLTVEQAAPLHMSRQGHECPAMCSVPSRLGSQQFVKEG